MIVYFTGTGNSRYCAQMLSDRLGDELTDSFHFIRDGVGAELASQRPWVFVSPTYAWRLPRIFMEFIRSGHFSGSREVYFVMTCGSEIGHAAGGNRALCAEKSLCYKGTMQVVMPENYIALYNAPEEAEAQKIVDSARPTLEKAIDCISAHQDFPAPTAGVVDRLKSGIVNPVFYRFIVKARPFTASNACIGCGKCVQNCVLGNIKLREGKPVWGDRCTHCMACICFCPAKAIEYGKASVGKPRYRCPPYRQNE